MADTIIGDGDSAPQFSSSKVRDLTTINKKQYIKNNVVSLNTQKSLKTVMSKDGRVQGEQEEDGGLAFPDALKRGKEVRLLFPLYCITKSLSHRYIVLSSCVVSSSNHLVSLHCSLVSRHYIVESAALLFCPIVTHWCIVWWENIRHRSFWRLFHPFSYLLPFLHHITSCFIPNIVTKRRMTSWRASQMKISQGGTNFEGHSILS